MASPSGHVAANAIFMEDSAFCELERCLLLRETNAKSWGMVRDIFEFEKLSEESSGSVDSRFQRNSRALFRDFCRCYVSSVQQKMRSILGCVLATTFYLQTVPRSAARFDDSVQYQQNEFSIPRGEGEFSETIHGFPAIVIRWSCWSNDLNAYTSSTISGQSKVPLAIHSYRWFLDQFWKRQIQQNLRRDIML